MQLHNPKFKDDRAILDKSTKLGTIKEHTNVRKLKHGGIPKIQDHSQNSRSLPMKWLSA